MAHTVVPWTTSFGRPASHRVVRGIHPAGPLWHAVVDSSQSTMAKGALIHVHPRYEPSWLHDCMYHVRAEGASTSGSWKWFGYMIAVSPLKPYFFHFKKKNVNLAFQKLNDTKLDSIYIEKSFHLIYITNITKWIMKYILYNKLIWRYEYWSIFYKLRIVWCYEGYT